MLPGLNKQGALNIAFGFWIGLLGDFCDIEEGGRRDFVCM